MNIRHLAIKMNVDKYWIKCRNCRESWVFAQSPRFGTKTPNDSEHCPNCGAFERVKITTLAMPRDGDF